MQIRIVLYIEALIKAPSKNSNIQTTTVTEPGHLNKNFTSPFISSHYNFDCGFNILEDTIHQLE